MFVSCSAPGVYIYCCVISTFLIDGLKEEAPDVGYNVSYFHFRFDVLNRLLLLCNEIVMLSVLDVPVKSNICEYLTFIMDVKHAMEVDFVCYVRIKTVYYNDDWFL